MAIQILQDIQLNGAIQFLDALADFPANPSVGTMVLKGTAIYAYVTIGGMETWYPFANRTNSYIHTQGLANTVWNITHNLNTTDVWVQIKDNDGKVVTAPVTVVDQDTVQINFTTALTGTAVIVAPDSINVPEVKASLITVGSNVEINTNGVLINGSYALTSANIQSDIDAAVAIETTARQAADAAIQTQITNNIDQAVKTTSTPTFNGLTTTGHIVPSTDVTYDLGSATKRFKDLYLSGTTIYVGDGTISYNPVSGKFDFKDETAAPVGVNLTSNTTDDLAEGTTNQYFTAGRASAAAPVQSVAGKTGTVTLVASDVGAIASTEKGAANGVAPLGADSKISSSYLPSYVDDVIEAANLAAFPATGETGKIYVALDTNKSYRWSGSAYIYITSGAVDSVAGKTGVVTLVKGDVGLSNVDNTSDANKPVSTAQQTALDLKLDKNTAITAGTATKITYDADGLVTGGASLAATDIPDLDAAKITSGTIATARLGSGTANSTTYLRGDGSWQTVSAGATLTDDTATNATYYPTFAVATSGAMTTAKVASTKLTFNPSTGQLNATIFNATSDRNAKDNIAPIVNALETVKQIQGVSFTWKDTGAKSFGYIAQDIEQVVPEVVATDSEGKKSVNYDATIAILLEAVKTLSAKVEELEAKVK